MFDCSCFPLVSCLSIIVIITVVVVICFIRAMCIIFTIIITICLTGTLYIYIYLDLQTPAKYQAFCTIRRFTKLIVILVVS